MNAYIESVLEKVKQRDANEPEFIQTVEEVLTSLEPVINQHPENMKRWACWSGSPSRSAPSSSE